MKKLDEMINQKANGFTVNSNTVNSYKKDINTVNSLTVNSSKTFEAEIEDVIEKHSIKSEGIALHLAQILDDEKSIKWYQLLVTSNQAHVLIEIAHYVRDKDKQGLIKSSKAIYFIAILRRRKIKTNFKENK